MTTGEYQVRARLPLALRCVQPEEGPAAGRGIPAGPLVDLPLARRHGEAPASLEELVARIGGLERKVDTLLELLLRREQQEALRSSTVVELEMQRLGFVWPEALAPGQRVELELVLGLLPPTSLRCRAEVERCTPLEPEGEEPPGFQVQARFVDLAETEADALHRYMLTVQRRSRRRNTDRHDELA